MNSENLSQHMGVMLSRAHIVEPIVDFKIELYTRSVVFGVLGPKSGYYLHVLRKHQLGIFLLSLWSVCSSTHPCEASLIVGQVISDR
jgi:hypothetical protein